MPTDLPKRPRLDFSEFHPLDHSLLNCIGYPGGRKRHLRYRWDYQWQEKIESILYAPWCLLGHHRWWAWYRGPGHPQVISGEKEDKSLWAAKPDVRNRPSMIRCSYCDKPHPAFEEGQVWLKEGKMYRRRKDLE